MTRWIDITKREPTEKDFSKSHRRGEAVFIVCTRDGSVGEWPCRGSFDVAGWFILWAVPPMWSGDTVVTHWCRMPRPPGEFWSRIRWWFQKWRTK